MFLVAQLLLGLAILLALLPTAGALAKVEVVAALPTATALVPLAVALAPMAEAFAAAVLGGLTSPFGAVIGGFLVGIFENLAGTYIPGVGNELKLPIALALIITVLVVKPNGLFGRTIVKRV